MLEGYEALSAVDSVYFMEPISEGIIGFFSIGLATFPSFSDEEGYYCVDNTLACIIDDDTGCY